jgi:hypothetical protein
LKSSYHVSPPEIGKTIAVDVVRVLIVVARLTDKLYDFLGFQLG